MNKRLKSWDEVEKLSPEERNTLLEDYKAEKEILIREYMRLQDIVDEYNQYIYDITKEVEHINMLIGRSKS